MASRIRVVKSLKKLGIAPKHELYNEHVTQFLLKEFKVGDDISEKNEILVKNVAGDFARKVKKFYSKECFYKFKYMLKKKKSWFDGVIKNPLSQSSVPEPKKNKGGRPIKNKGGAPKKDFSECKETAQLYKAHETKGDHSFEELLKALILKSSENGLDDCTWVLKKLQESPTVNASKFRSSLVPPDKAVIIMSPEECLATVIELKLTSRQYKNLRKKQKARHAKIFVSWHDILLVKRKCEPKNIDDTKVGEVSVPLQSVVDHQISKIMEKPYVRDRYDELLKSGRQFDLKMYGKYGADGTPNDTAGYQTADAGDYLKI